jgi:hypothetical protein
MNKEMQTTSKTLEIKLALWLTLLLAPNEMWVQILR